MRAEPDDRGLFERGDVEGLVEAAAFQRRLHDGDGRLVDGGVVVRREAILALGQLGPGVGNGTVAAGLRDRSDSVRTAAVHVLYARREPMTLAAALAWLPPGRSRELAWRGLERLRSTPVARAAARALVDRPGDSPISDDDAGLLLELSRTDRNCRPVHGVVQELIESLRGRRGAPTERAEDLLVRLAPRSTPILIRELERTTAPARAAAILGRIGDREALEPLVAALDHPGSSVRAEAARALGILGDPTAVEPLLRATRDVMPDVRAAAKHALDQMGTAAVIVGVATLLRPGLVAAATARTEQGPRPDAIAGRASPGPRTRGLGPLGEALNASRLRGDPDR